MQYTWPTPQTVSESKVYWFDDTGRGECRYPDATHVEYLDGTVWKAVDATSPYEIKGDRWCDTSFKPVTTTALRLVLKVKDGWAAGVRQWQVARD